MNCSKKRGLASCNSAPVNMQVFEPAFESRVLFINRAIEIYRDLVIVTFGRSDRASAREN